MSEPELETLAHGYGLIEGPRVDATGALYFSDVTRGGVYRRAPSGEVTVAIPKRRGVGGIALHADGGLVVSGRNICHVLEGETRIVFEADALGFNDLTTDASGRVLCGTIRTDPFGAQTDRTPGEAYRIGLDGVAEEMYGGVMLTNGIGFSPDGGQVYHSDTASHHLICHDVDGDRYVNRRALAGGDDFHPDGLAVDEGGTIWVADFEAGCVRGFDTAGREVDRIEVPSPAVTSLCFGGADRRDLYIVTAANSEDPSRGGTIFRTRVEVAGLAVASAEI
jgi:gluconolactonase